MSLALWPFYNWRYKDLSMSHYHKVMMLLPALEMCPMDYYQKLFLLPNLITVAPETRDKEICQSHVNTG